MKFGAVPVAEAEGAVLAHAVKQGGVVLRKGTVLSADDVTRLTAAGVVTVVTARLEPGDVAEDQAAGEVAAALASDHVRVEAPHTGRSNLFAEEAGILRINAAAINAMNVLDEAVTVATLPDFRAVVAGEMVGTVKIIPFSVPKSLAQRAAQAGGRAIRISPYRARSVAVISTLLPGLKPSVIDKTINALRERLAPSGSTITADIRIPHEAGALAGALAEVRGAGMVIVFGASAIADRGDVIPAALVASGGTIEHFGMPVDPGNLLLIGTRAGVPVLGAPGCARSPRENGFDWVLQRLLADVPVTRADIQSMGVGGLLMEIVARPQPRDPQGRGQGPLPIGVVVLAAGRSTRMGANKLLAQYRGKPLVRHVAEAGLAAGVGPVTVVTGHQAEAIRAALEGLPVSFVHNADFASGMASSL
ncbi:MAG: NTP transferase domain-containing protein, partial [Proteobacteria bacterium]|nr:NTP transferase domain-containing protein [Pseudomonadota bacterium]